jgi:uncharacterized protein
VRGAECQLKSKEAPILPHALFDTNLYLSYLLSQDDLNRTISHLIRLVRDGSFRLVLPEEVIDEVTLVVRTKPYFRQRITEREARSAMVELRLWAYVPPRLTEVPRIVRDPADDYLIAHAILERVDFLVTGDRDLLALDGEIDQLRIITAAAFLQWLDQESAEP